ncbi:MAG: DUF523 and DUF1722 domain-containing protein [Spirochaetales bacterium]|nr:DUF523 and DUF1722 domain-containing protein [Spirochaetales bacterium]
MFELKGKPKIGISTCLLGENVRYNGGHKMDVYLKKTLSKYVDFYPICPEVECGFGIPREAMQLHYVNDEKRLITINSKVDVTEQINIWLIKRRSYIKELKLNGYIFKSKSPSCGVYRTRLYRENQPPSLDSRGLFADDFINNNPFVPIEEEGRLHDHELRENFIERVFVHMKWAEIENSKGKKDLIDFHESIKYLLMSRHQINLKEMGKIVSNFKDGEIDEIYNKYFMKLSESLAIIATKKNICNVLEHIMGYFKKDLNVDEKQELKEIINNYSDGLVPLIVPITIINHYVRKYNEEYLKKQFFLNPHPLELMLRNHV